jgi:hypothetical protein
MTSSTTPPVGNRFRLLDRIRGLQATARQRSCRRKRISTEVQLVRREDGSYSLEGLCRCGSVNCPVCAGAIYARRADEVQTACELWRWSGRALGQRVVMLTLTIAHHLGDDVAAAVRGIHQAYRQLRAGRRGQALWKRLGIKHTVRATEATYGDHGWHVHLHVLLFVEGWDWMAARYDMSVAWRDAVEAKLGSKHMPSLSRGAVLNNSESDSYIVKLGLEVAAITKRARNKSRNPWQIAQDASDGDSESRKLWHDYVVATLGRQTLTWSAHARAAFGIDRSNDELAVMREENRFGVVEVLATWSGEAWDASKRADRDWTWRVMARLVIPPTGPPRHGVTIPMRETVGAKGPPRLPTAARCEPFPGLAAVKQRIEEEAEAELYPERAWYLKQRAKGRLREMFCGLNESYITGPGKTEPSPLQ